MSGCVIPVGPQFDDAEPNFPPYIVTSEPGVGSLFTPQDPDSAITVTLGDHNVGDALYLRWIIDYPNADPRASRRASSDFKYEPGTTVIRTPPQRFLPTCLSIPRTASPHRLVLSVADRPFLNIENGDKVSTDAPFDTVPESANRLRAVWLLNMDCPGGTQ